MTSCAASLTASSLSPSSGSGAGTGADARAADSGAATRWAAHLPSSPASTAHTSRIMDASEGNDCTERYLLLISRFARSCTLFVLIFCQCSRGKDMKASASSLAPSKTSPAARERARTLGAARSHAARATSASACPVLALI